MTTAVFLRSTTSSSSSRLRKVTLTMQSLLHTAAALQCLPTQHIHTKHATCSTGQSVMREPTSWVCRATHAGCQRGTCQAHGTHTRKASSERKLPKSAFTRNSPCVILTYSRQRTIKHLQRHTYLYIRNSMASVGIRPRAYA